MRSIAIPKVFRSPICIVFLGQLFASFVITQEGLSGLIQLQESNGSKSRAEEVRLGSLTAKGGFENEDEIRDKFNAWRTDDDARGWLQAMNYNLDNIQQVKATKPHGQKADVEVQVITSSGQNLEGISIKLVSTPQGFNQIDKRWLKTYVQKWNIPDDVHTTLKQFVGEVAPLKVGRDPRRMFLNELDTSQQQKVVDFFDSHRKQIVNDLFVGEGDHSAAWLMVTVKANGRSNSDSDSVNTENDSDSVKATNRNSMKSRWALCSATEAVAYFGSGDVVLTPAGNLKIGRITMQRKGGDNGRESANMLQFKINPAELFELAQ